MTTALISHPECVLHEISPGHPECPERIGAISDQLHKQQVFDLLLHLQAPLAHHDQLLEAHGERYVTSLFESSPKEGSVQLDADTAMNPYSLTAGLRGAGAALLATDAVVDGSADNAFCLIRPPGHHAEKNRAMGFCLFGNVALAARHAVREHGMERVAIVDFDVHHGNGTEDIVDGDPNILFCSSFQHPFYPGGYRESIADQRVNVPLAGGTDGAGFRQAIEASWLPALARFKPQMVFVSAGFDAHREDHLAGLDLDDADFTWITEQLMDVAATHAGGRLVSMLEGGYALPALGRCAAAHVRGLLKV